MIKRSPPKGWECIKAKVPFDPKGKKNFYIFYSTVMVECNSKLVYLLGVLLIPVRVVVTVFFQFSLSKLCQLETT